MSTSKVTVLIFLLCSIQSLVLCLDKYSENYEDLMNAVMGNDVQVQDHVDDISLLTNDIKPAAPVSIMSGEIPNDVIKKLADYIFSLMQGTGNVKKRTVSVTTTSTVLPETTQFYRKHDLGVVGYHRKIIGISRKKKNFGKFRKSKFVLRNGRT
ncbi:unnamed protein product [Caenorhabditis angaria]|uniref:Uncharacterized protein n=1 Tax=Caenorhabditis angaria TaxID=860376 RepID=A0A9P1IS43_9PELO|nr:unnamed protein product [Caenorhabditis angaria]